MRSEPARPFSECHLVLLVAPALTITSRSDARASQRARESLLLLQNVQRPGTLFSDFASKTRKFLRFPSGNLHQMSHRLVSKFTTILWYTWSVLILLTRDVIYVGLYCKICRDIFVHLFGYFYSFIVFNVRIYTAKIIISAETIMSYYSQFLVKPVAPFVSMD